MSKSIAKAVLVAKLVVTAGFVAFFALYIIEYSRGEARLNAEREERRSGKYAFGDQPALFAVAQAIMKNDEQAIRAAASAVPDLQSPGRDGATLLCFAVKRSWQQPELVAAVRTLLSLGADPNHTNGSGESFAMASAAHGSAAVLRAMLDAGGDANARDELGRPMITRIWYLAYYPEDQRARLDLLLERGADINAALPETDTDFAGYTVLLYRMLRAPENKDAAAYADALYLLERGADPNRVANDGNTFAKMLMAHRGRFADKNVPPPQTFEALWAWAQARGLVT